MNNIFKCTDMQARCHGKICALHAQCAEYLGNHADTNTYLSRHLIASLLRLIHIFTSLCLFLKKISFFSRTQPISTYSKSKIYTEFGAFLFKSLVKTSVSLLDKLLANFPQEQLRRIQIVC